MANPYFPKKINPKLLKFCQSYMRLRSGKGAEVWKNIVGWR
ncbi:hypothetical protein B4168_3464 [Anoxybacillus flavithermus]|nr:hypothetical protein B4168_3464 [Anoxybacillus flavithermus]OAO84542.1 hypothetical protein GT23_3393 [Parageobacillus thermoglucosidasius]